MRPEQLDYMSEQELFRENTISTKEEILADIDYKLSIVEDENNRNPNHSLAFYRRIKALLMNLRHKVENTCFFNELEDMWEYLIDIYEDSIDLRLQHCSSVSFNDEGLIESAMIDADIMVIQIKPKMLSVDEYATLYGVTPTTVRQWIRRGKLRSAKKIGGEWFISELTESTGRGYKRVDYSWNHSLTGLPVKYSFLNDYCHVCIEQDKGNKEIYHIMLDSPSAVNSLDDDNGFDRIIDMSSKEKEKLELLLIANPLVHTSSEYIHLFAL